ncbi:MAG: glycosyltransferase family 39 protein, partial [Phycisphaerae bacterium]|nr:glycosyltransferase family 39 protein [Phycisphaerae bacterium]
MISPKRATRPQLCLLGLIIAFAAAIRIYRIGAVGFWFDEVASIITACGHWRWLFFHQLGYFPHPPDLASKNGMRPLYELFAEADSHPPLYFFLLRGWWFLFGMSDVSCRIPSLIASLLAIVIVFDMGRLIANPTIGLWSAAMMAAAPTQLRYAQEARSYALLALFGAAACDVLLRIHLLGRSRRRWIAAAIFIAMAAWTHYFVEGAVLALIVFACLRMHDSSRRMLTAIVAFAVIALIAMRL